MQAIITRYLGPTNFRGSRIKASCDRGSITVSYDDALSHEQPHVAAANALIKRFVAEDEAKYGPGKSAWDKHEFVTGSIPSGEYVHVFID